MGWDGMGPDSYDPVERYATGTKAARHGALVRRHLQRIEGLALATTVSTLRNLKRWPSPKQQCRRCQLTEVESVGLSFRNGFDSVNPEPTVGIRLICSGTFGEKRPQRAKFSVVLNVS